MDIINRLFFKNEIISEYIKTRRILDIVESGECEYTLVSSPFVSIIEKISDKILLHIEIFINLFLIYEREDKKFRNIDSNVITYRDLKLILVKLYKDNESTLALEELLNEFYKIVYLNLKFYDNILKYDIVISIHRFFEYLENNNMIFLIEEGEESLVCNICTEKKKHIILLCCVQNICKDCWNKGNFKFCPYCKLDFTKQMRININQLKLLHYKNE